MDDLIRKTVQIWIKIGQRITGLKYVRPNVTLDLLGILKKSIIDFSIFTILFISGIIIYIAIFVQEKVLTSILFIVSIYFISFLQWFIGEILWCYLVWNPRAKKLVENQGREANRSV